MKRFSDIDSDRYHTAVACGLMCALVAGVFLLLASMALRLDLSTPAWYLGGMALLVVVVQLAGWVRWREFFAWLRSRPWRERKKATFAYRWKRVPLPKPDEVEPVRSPESTWRPHTSPPDDHARLVAQHSVLP
jgi:hypothetical protein